MLYFFFLQPSDKNAVHVYDDDEDDDKNDGNEDDDENDVGDVDIPVSYENPTEASFIISIFYVKFICIPIKTFISCLFSSIYRHLTNL